MIIGFGFGSPLESILMLVATSLLSYAIYKSFKIAKTGRGDLNGERARLRAYYLERRERAHRLTREFDLTDEEIERRVDEDLRSRH